MDIGYSNRDGTKYSAGQLDYGDCRRLQIVCPSCREPLMKRISIADTPYLAHYARTPRSQSCPYRVDSSGSGSGSGPGDDHGQRLTDYLQLLRDAVLKLEYGAERAKGEELVAALVAVLDPALDELRNRMAGSPVENARQRACRDEHAGALAASEDRFPQAEQARIAWDMWSTLLSGNARDNFVFLFAQAALGVQKKAAETMKKDGLSPIEQAVFETFAHQTNPLFPSAHINLRTYATRGPLADCVVSEMLRILVQLPYKQLRPA